MISVVKLSGLLGLILILSFISSISAATVAVDATKTYQTIDGFGACSAWIGNKITASLATQFWAEDTVDGHVGLSILRTRIDPSGSTTSESAAMTQAIKINPKVMIWAAAWTPPAKFKTNNSTVGGSLKSDATSQQGYADFLVKYVQDVKKNAGVDLYAVSCQNEPDFNPSYEGCQMTGEQFRVFVRDYWGPACIKAGITAKRMISESYRNDLAVSDPALKDSAAAAFVDIIGEHLYGGGPKPYPLAETLKKQYWETENSGMGGPNETIGDGINYANKVHSCLVTCKMNAYHYWWLVNNNNDDEGLCNSSGRPTPRMYTIGNFSKFIRPGFVRVDATAAPSSGITASAYYGATYGRLVIVVINSGSSGPSMDFTIAGYQGATAATPWLTNGSNSLKRQTPVAIANNAFSYQLTSQCVVTFVIENGNTSVKADARPQRIAAKVLRHKGGWRVEAPSAETPWTIQLITLSGREIMRKSVPKGVSNAVMPEPEHHAGVMAIRILQGGLTYNMLLAGLK
jgi:glucuronoarabinoxylan endo-1,4-beta-xylanase